MLPYIARHNDKVKGIIMLASPARFLAQLEMSQLRYILTLNGYESMRKRIDKYLSELELVAKHELKDSEFVMGAPASYYYEIEDYYPINFLKHISIPVLICQGGKDYQVTKKDFDVFKNDFSNDKHFTFKWYPNLSHIFTVVDTIPSPKNYNEFHNVDYKVIKDITIWIDNH